MAKQDFYEILGVSKSASPDELKRAYRKLAMQHHPDRNAGDKNAELKFKDLNEAYDILKDDQRRAAYDRFGHAAFEQGSGHGPGGFGFAAGGFADIFDEMFGEFMGGRRGQGGASRGSDLRYNLEVSLEEAYGRVRDGELWLVDCDIAVYPQASLLNHEPKRLRKLLLHRRELKKFAEQAGHRGLTLVPLSMYFLRGKVKVQIAIGREGANAGVATADIQLTFLSDIINGIQAGDGIYAYIITPGTEQ